MESALVSVCIPAYNNEDTIVKQSDILAIVK